MISNDRLELGLGAGWNQEECDAYSIELPPLRERFDRLEEALAVIVGLLSDETTDFDGRYYRLAAARCEPKPVQRPHPPVCIGGGGERRTLPIAARWAQHWNLAGGSPEVFAHKREVLLDHCGRIGRDSEEITTSVQIHLGPDQDPAELAEQAAKFAAVGCDLAVVPLGQPHDPRCSSRWPTRSLRSPEGPRARMHDA